MIRDLRLSDLPRQLFLGGLRGPDLVCTRETVGRGVGKFSFKGLAKRCILSNGDRCAGALVEGYRLRAVAVVRPRCGPRAWEMEHLYISPQSWQRCEEVLEHCSAATGQQGAHRLFLRVPQESALIDAARRTGFFPCHSETVYFGENPPRLRPQSPGSGLRPRAPSDDYLLYRLYNSCTPPQVRSSYGLTLEEWRDAFEPVRGKSQEWVLERTDALGAWLRLSGSRGTVEVEGMVRSEDPELVPFLYSFALEQERSRSRMFWLAPDYQGALQRFLTARGFQPVAHYYVLVKGVTLRVKEASLAPVGV